MLVCGETFLLGGALHLSLYSLLQYFQRAVVVVMYSDWFILWMHFDPLGLCF